MAKINPFDLLEILESELDQCMGYDHPQRKMIHAIHDSIECENLEDEQKLAIFLERERFRNK